MQRRNNRFAKDLSAKDLSEEAFHNGSFFFFVIIQHPLEKLMIQSDKVTNLTDLSGRGRE